MRGLDDGKNYLQGPGGDRRPGLGRRVRTPWTRKGWRACRAVGTAPEEAWGQNGPGTFQKHEKVDPDTAAFLRMLGGTTCIQQAGTDKSLEWPAKSLY